MVKRLINVKIHIYFILFLQKHLHKEKKHVNLHCVFHGIRLLRLTKIGCRETINFFCICFSGFYIQKLCMLKKYSNFAQNLNIH